MPTQRSQKLVSCRVVLVLLTAAIAAGCAVVVECDAVRLCRSLVPAFNSAETTLDVRTVDAARTVHGTLVTVSYLTTRGPEALGAMSVAVAETLWSAFFPIEYRDLVIFSALAAVLALRPEGLFGGTTR